MQPIVSSGILSPWEPGIFSLAIYDDFLDGS